MKNEFNTNDVTLAYHISLLLSQQVNASRISPAKCKIISDSGGCKVVPVLIATNAAISNPTLECT